jgi:hypothetical protein
MNKKAAIQAMLDEKILQDEDCTHNLIMFDTAKGLIDEANCDVDVNDVNFHTFRPRQEPPKTESWAKFRVHHADHKKWVEQGYMCRNLEEFRNAWKSFLCSHHHEIPNTRVELPVVEN